MHFELDAKVRTSDGHDAGRVRRVVLDPRSGQITGFVVSTGGLLGHDAIVAEDDLAEASPDGTAVTLRIPKKELEARPIFDEGAFTLPPSAMTATMGYGFPSQAYLTPLDVGDDRAAESTSPTLKKGDVVKDRDGDTVGVVEEIRFDPASNEISGFTVKAGAGVERLFGAGELAEIDRDQILEIFEGGVRLAIDRDELASSERESGAR